MNTHSMNTQHTVTTLVAEANFASIGIPLLDDGFDPDETDVLEQDEHYHDYLRHNEEDLLF